MATAHRCSFHRASPAPYRAWSGQAWGIHAEVARLILSHGQRQPLCLRLLPHLLARQQSAYVWAAACPCGARAAGVHRRRKDNRRKSRSSFA
eukprot:scaffold74656_cov57-Phaeocystis_antarctica.AAC.2